MRTARLAALVVVTTTSATLVALLIAAAPAMAAQPTIVPPKLTAFVQAKLPADAGKKAGDRKRIEVQLLITIKADGSVSDVVVKRGFGEPFDSAAVTAAKAFGFRPASVDGQPIPVKVPFTYVFNIEEKKPKPPEKPPEKPPDKPSPPPGTTVSGRLFEKGTRAKVLGETVILERAKPQAEDPIRQTVSDGEGRFVFEGVPVGKWLVRLAEADFEAWKKTFSVSAELVPVKLGRITLYPKATRRYRTVLKQKKKKDSATSVRLSEKELKSVPGTFGDPSRVVATLPGVARSPFGLGFYVVRGADFDNTGTHLDGFTTLLLYHLGGGPAVIHPEFIADLEFYPGGYPVEYGRYAAGLINMESKEPPTDRWHLVVDIDLLKAGAYFSVPFDEGKGTVSMAFRRSYYELILPLFVDDLMVSYWDYQFRVSYQPQPETKLTFFVLGSSDDVETSDEPPEKYEESDLGTILGFMFHRLLIRVDHRFSRDTTLRSDTLLAYNLNDIKSAAIGQPTTRIRTNAFLGSTRLVIDHKFSPAVRIRGGFDVQGFFLDADVAVPPLGVIGELPKPSNDGTQLEGNITEKEVDASVFLSVDWLATKGFRLIPGVRLDYFGYSGRHNVTVDPRLTFRYTPEPRVTIKGAIGLFHQAPAINEIDEDYGNPELPPLTSVQTSLGLELRLGGGWELDVTAFYNTMFDMPVGSGAVSLEGEDIARANFVPAGAGRSYGMELMFRKRFGDFFHGWLTYTISRSEREDEFGVLQPFGFDQTHILNLAWTFDLPYDWSIGFRFRLTTGNPTRRIVGAEYDADKDGYNPKFDGFERLPVFHQLDLRIDKKFRFDDWIFMVYIDVQNVYYAENAESYRYNYNFSQREAVAGLPIIPTLGLRGIF